MLELKTETRTRLAIARLTIDGAEFSAEIVETLLVSNDHAVAVVVTVESPVLHAAWPVSFDTVFDESSRSDTDRAVAAIDEALGAYGAARVVRPTPRSIKMVEIVISTEVLDIGSFLSWIADTSREVIDAEVARANAGRVQTAVHGRPTSVQTRPAPALFEEDDEEGGDPLDGLYGEEEDDEDDGDDIEGSVTHALLGREVPARRLVQDDEFYPDGTNTRHVIDEIECNGADMRIIANGKSFIIPRASTVRVPD